MNIKWQIFTVLTFVIALAAIIISRFEIEYIVLESTALIEWIIGILSILVTILITWQIMNYVSFEQRMKQYTKDEIKKEASFIGEYTSAQIFLMQASLMANRYDFQSAIDMFFYALPFYVKHNMKDISTNIINQITNIILKTNETTISKINIKKERKERWLETLYDIKNKDETIRKLINFITELKTEEN